MAEALSSTRSKSCHARRYLDGEYGMRGVYAGVPVQIGAGGVEKIRQIGLSPEEKAMFDRSFQSVKKKPVDEIRL